MFYLQSLSIPRKRVRSWVIVTRFYSYPGLRWLRLLGSKDRRYYPCHMVNTLSLKAIFRSSLRYESPTVR